MVANASREAAGIPLGNVGTRSERWCPESCRAASGSPPGARLAIFGLRRCSRVFVVTPCSPKFDVLLAGELRGRFDSGRSEREQRVAPRAPWRSLIAEAESGSSQLEDAAYLAAWFGDGRMICVTAATRDVGPIATRKSTLRIGSSPVRPDLRPRVRVPEPVSLSAPDDRSTSSIATASQGSAKSSSGPDASAARPGASLAAALAAFIAESSKSVGQRAHDQILKKHILTEAEFQALPPESKAQINKEAEERAALMLGGETTREEGNVASQSPGRQEIEADVQSAGDESFDADGNDAEAFCSATDPVSTNASRDT